MWSLKGWPLQGQSLLRDLGRTLGVVCDWHRERPWGISEAGGALLAFPGSLVSSGLGAAAGGFRVENALGSPLSWELLEPRDRGAQRLLSFPAETTAR